MEGQAVRTKLWVSSKSRVHGYPEQQCHTTRAFQQQSHSSGIRWDSGFTTPNWGASKASICERILNTSYKAKGLEAQQLIFELLSKLSLSPSSYSLKKALSKIKFIVPDSLVGRTQLPRVTRIQTTPGQRAQTARLPSRPTEEKGHTHTTTVPKTPCVITRFSRQVLFQLERAPRAFHYQVTALQNLHRQEVFCKSHVTHT